MLAILSTNSNIYFHLAAEEYLLKNTSEEICMLWQSEDAVVVGKHQNAMGEANYLWCLANNIPIARRLSGGGTVFHGNGNLNFTFIRNGEKGKLVDFKRFVKPVVNYLQSIGVPAEIGTRNDILANGLKISGNAEHVYKSRILHHGTLLFNADLSKLNQAIKVPSGKYTSKAVPSNRSKVSNISAFMSEEMNFAEFIQGLFTFLKNHEAGTEVYTFTEAEYASIGKLVKEKFTSWEWIYGYSPRFELNKISEWNKMKISISLNVEKGIISKVRVEGFQNENFNDKLNKLLPKIKYEVESVRDLLLNLGLDIFQARELSRLFF